MIPGAGAETAVTVIEFEQSAMGAADDQASVFAGEFIRRPVQRYPCMRTFIDIGPDQLGFADNEHAEREAILGKGEFTSFPVFQFLQSADHRPGLRGVASLVPSHSEAPGINRTNGPESLRIRDRSARRFDRGSPGVSPVRIPDFL